MKNFFALIGYHSDSRFSKEKSIKFISAFLISSFGQIQFEIHGNSQEGSRKIEKRNIEKILVPDPGSLSKYQLDKVLEAYHSLDAMNIDILGIEEINLRDELDSAIAEIMFMENNLGFEKTSIFKEYFQKFLKELVENRVKP